MANKTSAARKKKSRSLWSSDNGGRFRTRGRNSSATVRGTEWLTKDTCSGTETRVTRGSVLVKDFTKHKNVVVKAGKRYIAKAKKSKKK
jgi:ferric-dicitrate binding protein FerR (iron transport regulator)